MKIAIRKSEKPHRRSAHRGNERRLVTQHPRRRILGLAAGAVALPAASRIAWGQAYPTRPITMVVPSAAGGPSDVLARILANRMRTSLGQPVIIENVGGADGSIGTGRVARARPDGYTIDVGFLGPNVLNGAFYSLPYDVLNDLTPVAPLATISNGVFARKTLPAKDLKELVTWLKANPNKASMGVTAVGIRLVATSFQKETGTQFALVPYRGTALAVQDLVAGQIDLYIGTLDAMAQVRDGSIKAYAVMSDTRSPLAPDIPTIGEMDLPALTWSAWYGLFAPKGTPRGVIDRLNTGAVEALADPAVQVRLAEIGMKAFPPERQTPEALGTVRRIDAEKWWPIIKELGIKAE